MSFVRREGLTVEMNRMRRQTATEWRKHPTLMRFLQDHQPQAWSLIESCRMQFLDVKEQEGTSRHKVVPWTCHQVPYCIHCVQYEENKRVAKAIYAFHRCTPAGRVMRGIHMVQTAPVYFDGPEHTWPAGEEGWGKEASHNRKKFRAIMLSHLKEMYGSGIGGMFSYQDFGERAFMKRHPHMDLTLNGWMLQDGKAKTVTRYDFTGNGRERWDDKLAKRAMAFRLDAKRGNIDVGHIKTGPFEVRSALKYGMRELVDLRKMEYSRTDKTVHWKSYKDESRARHTVLEFKAGMAEYEYRLGAWGHGDKKQELHVAVGHLAKKVVGDTQEAIGGELLEHGKRCPCEKCTDWYSITLNAEEQAVFDAQVKVK